MFARFFQASQRRHALCLSALIALTPTLLLTSNAYAQRRGSAFVYQPASKSLSDKELVPFADQLSAAVKSAAVQTKLEMAEFRLKDALLIVGCDSPSDECMDRLAQSTSVQRTYYVIIEREQNLYRVNFNYYDLSTHQFEKAERFIRRSDLSSKLFYDLAFNFLSGHLSHTRLNVFTTAKNLELRIEGRDFGSLPRSIETLVPDTYSIWVGRNGEQKWTDEVKLENDRPYTINISEDSITGKFNITKSEGTAKPGADTANASVAKKAGSVAKGPRVHWGAWTLIGVGGGSLIGGLVLGAMVKNVKEESQNLYNLYAQKQNAGAKDDELQAIYLKQQDVNKKGKMYEGLQFGALGLGAAALVAGLGWMTYDLVKTKDSDAPQTTAGLVGQSLNEAGDFHSVVPDSAGMHWHLSVTPTSLQSKLVW